MARYIEHFVGCCSEGSAGLKGGGYGSVGSPLSLATSLHTHNSEHLDYCDGSLCDIVCNLCMVDKSNLTNRSLVTDGD